MVLFKRLVVVVCVGCVCFSCKSTPPKGPPVKSDFVERLARMLEKNDFAGALGLFDQLSPEEAGLPRNLILKSSVLISAGEPQLARGILEPLIQQYPANMDARYTLSVVEGAQKKLRQQRTILEDIVKEAPAYVPALNDLGRISIENQKNLNKAAAYYESALKADPADEDALIGRARVWRLEKNYDEALGTLSKAIGYHPKSAMLYSERGRLYRNRGALDEALSDLDAAVKLDPSDYWFSYDRGLVLLDKNRKKDALDEFRRAVRINPDNFISYVYTAGISDELGLDVEAEQQYKKLAAIKPDYYFGFEGIGVHSLKRGEWLAAKDAFVKAWQYAPQEVNYALLAAYAWLKAAKNSPESRAGVKKLMNDAMKQVKRDSTEYFVLRMYAEGMGDADIARRAEKENNELMKARAYFYLACYYDVHNLPALSEKFSEEFKAFNRRDVIEYRINEFLHTGGSNIAAGNTP
ncbi:MAG: tetratricopeptide repeat protein [Spirochaetaceae bacterium]|jgi:tetratricopeptide (TPR) repeat protein|nr:tetratricopeptide repeat protein [Spirochaetaceae bacterium]